MITSTFIPGNQDASEAFAIREEVFVEEQNCPKDIEFDEYDKDALHLLVYFDEEAAATGRIWHDGDGFRIGRLAVRKKFRGQKIGDLAIRVLLYKAFNSGAEEVSMNAQKYIIPFYEKFGLKKQGEEFMEGGRPHYLMKVNKDEVKYPSNCCGH